MPAAETWDLLGGRCDGEPHLGKLRLSVHLCQCMCECVWERGGRKWALRGILTHNGSVKG